MKKSKVVKTASKIIGTTLQYNVIITGALIGGIAVILGKKKTGKAIQRATLKVGRYAGKAIRTSGELAGVFMEARANEGVRLRNRVSDKVVKTRVRIYGDANEFFNKEKMVEAEFTEMKNE
ncbi:hypothetical protein NBE98_16225 [Clostridium swellfunianum]|uniref:hypothetical protein n=1 Tax=Clostridium swellfunianum TaxID=1367462 RepID=UPI00202EF8B0|nr:hypothetical protein [Clostridium swellfunianum]MCM0649915.1 hypothetical protein [Clostridium swellfunianum]